MLKLLLLALTTLLILVAAALPMPTRHYFLHTTDIPEGYEVEYLQLTPSGTWNSSRDFMDGTTEVDNVREEGDNDPAPSSLYPYYTIGA